MKKLVISSAIALAFCTSAAYASSVVSINPTGSGATFAVNALDWDVGNAISLGVGSQAGLTGALASGTPFDTYAMAGLANFKDSANKVIGGTGLNSAFEWTFVTGFQEKWIGHWRPAGGRSVLRDRVAGGGRD